MKQSPLIFTAIFLSLALAACGELPPPETASSDAGTGSPVSVVLSDGKPDGDSMPESAAPTEPAAKTPVGEFWSLPDDTPAMAALQEHLEALPWQQLHPDEAPEGMTVGEVKEYWQSLSPDDERLSSAYAQAPAYTVDLAYEGPLLQQVGDSATDGVHTVTLSSLQTDGYITYLTLDYTGGEEVSLLQEWGNASPPPGYAGGSWGCADGQYRLFRFSSLPFPQFADRAETPFPFAIDLMLEDYKMEAKNAVFPKADNTKEGYAPVSAQLSPLSLAVTFASVGVTPAGIEPDGTITLEMTGMQPVRLLSGAETRYTIGPDETYGRTMVHNIGSAFIPAAVPTVAGAYDYRTLQTLTVCGDAENREIFPDYDEIDAIEFEGVVYPLQ